MAETLIEGCNAATSGAGHTFEGSQVSGWNSLNNLLGGSKPTTDATHKTEGSTAWKFTAFSLGGGLFVNGFYSPDVTLDLTGYTSIKLDYYGETVNSGDCLVAYVESGDQSDRTPQAVLNPTGAGTITLDLAGITDISSVTLAVFVNDDGNPDTVPASATSTIHIDNIRGVTAGGGGGGQPIAKRFGGIPFAARNRGVW